MFTTSNLGELQSKMCSVVKAKPSQELAEKQLRNVIAKRYSELSEGSASPKVVQDCFCKFGKTRGQATA